MKKEPVTISLLKTIINYYPIVPSHLIHSAGRRYCLSGGQRLRALRQKYPQSLYYNYADHKYHFAPENKIAVKFLLQMEMKRRGLK